ncbi:DUF72 domain-containing protein [Actinosynnema sp. NPDC020468]|uniref:DUF72 domain-containing protein n=1 Tax=Actinosynnema sp. NPDC020468 TaxID=3154488 RepID=UPI00340E7536
MSRRVDSVEPNGTFHSLETPADFRAWHAATPDDFVSAVEGGRFITHMKRLRDAEEPVRTFFASGALELGAKLGPVRWQLPPTPAFDPDPLTSFFAVLPPARPAPRAPGGPGRRRHRRPLPGPTHLTADFVHVRLHGEDELYAGGYTDEALGRAESRTHDVHAHFDNDAKVTAPRRWPAHVGPPRRT